MVDKPAGVVVHPGHGNAEGTLVQALAGRVAGGPDPLRPGVVHRLDKDTSGLLLLARDEATHAALQEALRARHITREYLALVEGRPPAKRGTIDAALGRDRRHRTRISTDTDDPHHAITHFETERALPDDTLLRVRLETGRTHQIRAHLLAIGHPVAGDPEYGHAEAARTLQAIPACRATCVRSSANRGTNGSAGATAGGPGQGPPAGVRGTGGPFGVGGPRPTRHRPKTQASAKTFLNCLPTSFRPPGVSFQMKLVPRPRSCPVRHSAGSAPPRSRGLYNPITRSVSTMAEIGLRELLEAGVHFGHQTRRWNPKMRRFIHGENGGIYLIDLLKTQVLLNQAQQFAAEIAHRGGTVLFVGTKKQARDGIKEIATAAEHAVRQPPLAGRPADELPDDVGCASSACTTSSATPPRASSRCCPRVSACPPRPTS